MGLRPVPFSPAMQLVLGDPAYTERLASFLRSVGQSTVLAGPAALELRPGELDEAARLELEIYLRVWRVLYPDADVTLAA
jgi:hypothetical protein